MWFYILQRYMSCIATALENLCGKIDFFEDFVSYGSVGLGKSSTVTYITLCDNGDRQNSAVLALASHIHPLQRWSPVWSKTRTKSCKFFNSTMLWFRPWNHWEAALTHIIQADSKFSEVLKISRKKSYISQQSGSSWIVNSSGSAVPNYSIALCQRLPCSSVKLSRNPTTYSS